MKSMVMLALALAGLPTAALADKYQVAVPGAKWAVTFQAPRMELHQAKPPALFSASNDRLQVTAFADPPKCPGDDSTDKVYECFANSLKANEAVKWDSERANRLPNGGAIVMYLTESQSNGVTSRAFNADFLQAHEGKWIDVHVSLLSPGEGDVQAVVDIIDSVAIGKYKPPSTGKPVALPPDPITRPGD